jgi:alpha-glucosidase
MDGQVFSPDNRLKVFYRLNDGIFEYRAEYEEKEIVGWSKLVLTLSGEGVVRGGVEIVRVNEQSVDENWETIYGEERIIRNHYNEAAVFFAERMGARRIFTLRFRVFDDGFAYRLEIPVQPKFQRLVIMNEVSEFNISPNSYVWTIPAYQKDRYEYIYSRTELMSLTEAFHTPATFELPNGLYLAIHEARLINYGAMNLVYRDGVLRSEVTPLHDGIKARVDLPWPMPWRMVMVAKRAIELTQNRMMLNLNDKPMQDFSWVKPLKYLGIWWAMYVGEWTWAPGELHGATTEHALSYIDSCVSLGIKGFLAEGWNNGWEGDWLQNGATTIFSQAIDDFDADRVAEYADRKGVEIITHHETVGYADNYERQLEDTFVGMARHNIHYAKLGYANEKMDINGHKEWHASQLGVEHYQRAVELAAKYHIMLDIHEPIKSTGLERTWPNLMTREGARGQEYAGGDLPPHHTCCLPFTRMLAGGFDITPGIFDVTNPKRRVPSTIIRQLAYYVVFYSAIAMAADRPFMYETFPDLFKFIREVPVSWEKTVPVMGEINKYYGVARKDRGSSDWYFGAITDEAPREVEVPLDFLDSGSYIAEIYLDGEDADYMNNPISYKIITKKVKRGDKLTLKLAAGGGVAIRLSHDD